MCVEDELTEEPLLEEDELYMVYGVNTISRSEISVPLKIEPLPGVLGNTGTVAFIFREQGIFSNYFQGTGELLTRLLGSFLGTRGFSNGEQGIKSKKVKGSWEHAPPPGRGSRFKTMIVTCN